MTRHHALTIKFPGRAAVLVALRAAGGTWTPTDVARWGRSNGGTRSTYQALTWYVQRGVLAYDGKRWTYVPAYRPRESQIVQA